MNARTLTRLDTSTVGRWWWTVDKWMLATVASLLAIGILLTLAAGPPAAERIGVDAFHFVRKQALFMPLVIMVMFTVSLLSAAWVRRVAALGFAAMLLLMIATLLFGDDINGARRWVDLGPLPALQPSEFMKPCFAVVTAWMFAKISPATSWP